MAHHFRKADSVISTIYEDSEQDLEMIEIQEYRSQNRKIRYNLLPIILSILKDCPHQSNLYDLAMRYDKYKKKSMENSLNLDSIINQAVFSQSRSNINPYESQIKLKEVNQQELRKDSKSMMKITIDLLKKTYEKQNEQLNDLNNEKQLIKDNINAYFNEKLDDAGYLQRSINQYNYNGNEQQVYFQQLNKLQLPQLQDQKNSLQQTIQEQQIQTDNLKIIMEEYEQIQNQFVEQNEYLIQLTTAKQQLDKQVQQIKVKIQYMMLEYENIQIQENIDKFKAFDLPKEQINKFIELIEKSKYYSYNDTPTSFRKMLNFESMVEINMDNSEIKQLEDQYENKVKQLIEQYEQKKSKFQQKKQEALIEQADLQLIQQKRQIIENTLKLTLKQIEQRKLDMDTLEKEEGELLYQQRLMKDKIEWLQSKK